MVYRGIGNEFRELSQAGLLYRLHRVYEFNTVLQAPYDHSTDPETDNKMFSTYEASRSLQRYAQKSFDLVWNFGFLQRVPFLIKKMVYVSRRFVLAFVPNFLNPGTILHRAYHYTHGSSCDHPERGFQMFMSLKGLEAIFVEAKVKVLEAGYVDAPLWFDTVVTLTELAGSSSRRPLRIPFTSNLLSVERLTLPFGKVMAHHVYVFGSVE